MNKLMQNYIEFDETIKIDWNEINDADHFGLKFEEAKLSELPAWREITC